MGWSGENFQVLVLLEWTEGLFFVLSSDAGGEFVLRVGNQVFEASDSSVPRVPAFGRYWWPLDASLWSVGDTVDVALLAEGGAAVLRDRPFAPPSVRFRRLSDSHDGSSSFAVRLDFGENMDIDAAALAAALDVSGGSLTAAAPISAGSTREWSLTVSPDTNAAVTVALDGGGVCGEAGTLCTADGLAVHNSPEMTVAGPP